jgi:ribonuclease T2
MRLSTPILAIVLSAAAAPALAAPACSPPPGLTPASALSPRPDEVVSGVTVAYYVLALNWTPEWCRSGGSGAAAREMECATPHGFTLHGLWPDGARPPYPRFCHPAGQLDAATVRQMYCRTPSAVLLQHEWQAHGTCSNWPDAKAFFGQSSKLYDALKVPPVERLKPGALTAGDLRAAFVAANPALKADEVYVQSNRTGALTEVRVCYGLLFQLTACPGGNGAPDHTHIDLAPSLTGAF